MRRHWIVLMSKAVGAVVLAGTGLLALGELPASAAPAIAFSTQPGPGTVNGAFSTQPVVTVSGGGSSTASITLTITPSTGTSGAVLSCTSNPVSANGSSVATFSGCAINLAGVGYTLTATDKTDSGNPTATSATFNVVGPAAKLAFTTQPTSATAGAPLPTQPVVGIEDVAGNIVTSDVSPITLSLSAGLGPTGASLTCTSNTVTPVGGVATFSGCLVRAASTLYTLTAIDSIDSLSVNSSVFTIVAAPTVSMVFTTEPGNGVLAGALSPQPVVTLEDVYGNTAVNDTSPVTLSITSGTGGSGATLSCAANPVTPLSGVASFSGCTINAPGTNYSLTASNATEILSVTSTAFTVSEGTTSLALTSNSPGSVSAGSTVMYTATVTRLAGSSALNGSVSFLNGSNAISNCTNVALAGGVATCSVLFSSTGTNTITATYANDSFLGGSSAAITQVVNKPSPKLTLRPAAPKVAPGHKFLLKVGLSGSLGKPTGVVVITYAHHVLCSAHVVKGTASCTISTRYLHAGHRSVSIRYAGSSTYATVTETARVTVT